MKLVALTIWLTLAAPVAAQSFVVTNPWQSAGLPRSSVAAASPSRLPARSFTVERASASHATTLAQLIAFANRHGATITSTRWGRHNPGSEHYASRAIDVSTRGLSNGRVELFKQQARNAGYIVRDERVRPAGQRVWLGEHLHLELPK